MKYSIGDRFLVECKDYGLWFIKGSELREIFGEETIRLGLFEAYKGNDVYWILGVKLGSPKEAEVVIKGDKIVSYFVLEEDKFYINHYGQLFRGRIEVGQENGILMNGKDLEVEVRKGKGYDVYLSYNFLGDKVTPKVEVAHKDRVGRRMSGVVCFPEFSRVYSGEIYVNHCWGCLNVWVLQNNMLYFYLLLRDGKEYLVYESSKFEKLPYDIPKLHMNGNIMFVYFDDCGKGKEIVEDLRRIPGFAYLYVRESLGKDLYISFNRRKWEKVGIMDRVILKGGALEFYPFSFQVYFRDAFEQLAKKLSDHSKTHSLSI